MTFSEAVATAADGSVATAAAPEMQFPSRGARFTSLNCLLLGAISFEQWQACSALLVRLARRRGPCTSLGLSSKPDKEHSRCTSISELQRQTPAIPLTAEINSENGFASSSMLIRVHASLIHTE